MAIPLSGRFDYVVSIRDSPPPWLAEQHARDKHAPAGGRLRDERLVGLAPTLSISGNDIKLDASSRNGASVMAASFELAPGLTSLLRAHDVLQLVRTGSGGIAVSIVRSAQLLVNQ
jgi:hypothetical protein